jgi:hypothetical protein
MESELLYNKIENLPLEAKIQVFAFINSLESKYKTNTKEGSSVERELAKEKFIGLWKERKEFEDSTAWVKELRKKDWK